METANEKSTSWLTITFRDKAGDPEAPASAEYRVDSIGGNELRAWTPIGSPTAVYELTLTPDDNTIVDASLFDDLYQINVVTVRGVFGADDEHNDIYKYRVKDLAKLPKA